MRHQRLLSSFVDGTINHACLNLRASFEQALFSTDKRLFQILNPISARLSHRRSFRAHL